MAQTLKEYLDEKLKANSLREPDRNPLVAPQADLAKKVKALLNKYETKKVGNIDSPWNKYGAGMSIGDLLFGESPELLDDMSYGKNPLTSGGRTGRIPIPDKRLLDMPVPIPSTGGMGVIKKEGQNWLTGSVERALKGLKSTESELRRAANRPGGMETENAVNSWIDGPLTKYIKNRMATPSDEVRKLADHGILHYEPSYLESSDALSALRNRLGFPEEGVASTQLGKSWEQSADYAVPVHSAGEYTKPLTKSEISRGYKSVADEQPWLSKLDPNTPVYRLDDGFSGIDNLGIPHLIDELLNATNPESKFPQHLRMKPEGFKGLTMEEAVKKVHGINQHRALQAEAARKKFSRADGIATSKKYDDGFRFVAPEDTRLNTDHHDYVVDAGKRGAWCTQGACDTYAGGNSRVEILLDDFGNPHAQIQIKTETPAVTEFLKEAYKQKLPNDVINRAYEKIDYDSMDMESNTSNFLNSLIDDGYELSLPSKQSIAQIKPIGNSWDHKKVQELMAKDPDYQKKIQEKLQDFVKSGNWESVGDLEMAGLYRQGDRFMSKEDFLNEPGFKEWLANRYDRPQNDDEILGYYQTFIRDTEVDGGI